MNEDMIAECNGLAEAQNLSPFRVLWVVEEYLDRQRQQHRVARLINGRSLHHVARLVNGRAFAMQLHRRWQRWMLRRFLSRRMIILPFGMGRRASCLG